MKFSHKSQHCESGYMGPLGHDSLRLQAIMSWAALLPWDCQKRQTQEVLLDLWPWLTLTLPANAIHISLSSWVHRTAILTMSGTLDLEEEEDDEEKETPPLKKREKPKKLKSKTEIHCQECIILAVLKLSIPNAWQGSDSVLQTISEDAMRWGSFIILEVQLCLHFVNLERACKHHLMINMGSQRTNPIRWHYHPYIFTLWWFHHHTHNFLFHFPNLQNPEKNPHNLLL